ncbi:YbjO family protein [Nissabacter sp. SGAir0207]|uniref:YbjO family protein n=1 Tax=Nissabacter sp. SGAir0207 TaxID=2126321 RepID=UPI0010CCEEA0|nr:YbjO family protein [Nissabacter sp. SGAir0207]QCR35814.1 DUF2593 domain-containing protein [Nissabacter sp. SGAir0207]
MSRLAFIPVPVMVGATAIIATRLLGFLLLFDELGLAGVGDFVRASTENWINTLLLLCSLLIILLEAHCAYAVMRARNWGRWLYLGCQLVVVLYMVLASCEWFGPKIFRIENADPVAAANQLMMQKLPDALVLLLLFLPPSSRRFFTRRR